MRRTLRILMVTSILMFTSATLTLAQDLIIALPAPSVAPKNADLPPAPSSKPSANADTVSGVSCDADSCTLARVTPARALAATAVAIPLKAIQYLVPGTPASRSAITGYSVAPVRRLFSGIAARSRSGYLLRRPFALPLSLRMLRYPG